MRGCCCEHKGCLYIRVWYPVLVQCGREYSVKRYLYKNCDASFCGYEPGEVYGGSTENTDTKCIDWFALAFSRPIF